jgi:hypothetical protein
MREMASKGRGGLSEEVPGRRCQYEGILIEGVVAMLIRGEDGDEAVFEWMAEDGAESQDQRAVCRWLRRRAEWGKIETTRISQIFHHLARLHRERFE